MKRLLALLFLLPFAVPAFADSITSAGLKLIENPVSNGDMRLRVNVGGTKTDALIVTGSTGAVSIGGTTGTNGILEVKELSGSAQIKLTRTGSSSGSGYIGADSTNAFSVYDGATGGPFLQVAQTTGAVTVASLTVTGGLTRSGDDAIWAVGASQAVNVSTGSTTQVVVAASVDVTSAFASNVYTCKRAGIYRLQLSGSIQKSSGTATLDNAFDFEFRKNGTTIQTVGTQTPAVEAGPSGTGPFYSVSNTALVTLAVGDTIDAAAVANFAGGLTWVGQWLGMNLVITRI